MPDQPPVEVIGPRLSADAPPPNIPPTTAVARATSTMATITRVTHAVLRTPW